MYSCKNLFYYMLSSFIINFHTSINKIMCQCVICDCWWANVCGACCSGWHAAYCCASCWLCKPLEILAFDPDCCNCCLWTGWGGNFCCYGCVYCAPMAVKNYSRVLNGEMVGGGDVVIITQQSPVVNQGPLLTNNPY